MQKILKIYEEILVSYIFFNKKMNHNSLTGRYQNCIEMFSHRYRSQWRKKYKSSIQNVDAIWVPLCKLNDDKCNQHVYIRQFLFLFLLMFASLDIGIQYEATIGDVIVN